MQLPQVFVHRSVLPASAATVFAWHERPQALRELLPRSRWVRIESRTGGIRDGGRVTIAVGVGPFVLRWQARHFGFVPGCQFCDEQVNGPFALWRHVHRVVPIGTAQCLYEDRLEYALPGGRLVNRLLAGPLRWALRRTFERRHATVRARVVRTVVPRRLVEPRATRIAHEHPHWG
jgi:ligand-binding SRPBCC domain-containing protein